MVHCGDCEHSHCEGTAKAAMEEGLLSRSGEPHHVGDGFVTSQPGSTHDADKRVVSIGCGPNEDLFSDNAVHTAKYNVFTFFPLNLYQQFQLAANFYFLVLSGHLDVSMLQSNICSPVCSACPVSSYISVQYARIDNRCHQFVSPQFLCRALSQDHLCSCLVSGETASAPSSCSILP